MRKLIYVLFLLLVFVVPCSGDSETVYQRSITINQLGTDAPTSHLVTVDMLSTAGVIVGLEIDGRLSDDWQMYIFDNDYEGSRTTGGWWHDQTTTCVDNDTIKEWDYDSAVTGIRDDDTIWFTNDDTTQTNNLYIGFYNDDPSYTTDITIDIEWLLKKHSRLPDISQ